MDSRLTPLETSTEELVRLARSGDQGAFAGLVNRFHRVVMGYVSGIVHDRDVADDVAQDVFLAAYQSLDRFNEQSKFSTWLIGIARNKSISALRQIATQRKREEAAGNEILLSLRAEYLEQIKQSQRQEQIDALRTCLDKLPAEQRSWLNRHYHDNESAQSIAVDVGRSGSGMRMLFLRLRHALYDCIQQQLHTSTTSFKRND